VRDPRPTPLVMAICAVVCALGCSDRAPTMPTNSSSPSTPTPAPSTGTPQVPGETFHVSGTVTDDRGTPIAGAQVTMASWLGGRAQRPFVMTDALGHYEIAFTSNPWTQTTGRGAARAEVVVDGYEWFWRTVWATGSQLVENFRMQRTKRIAPGDSVVVAVTSDNGECHGWLYDPCGRLHLVVPGKGGLTVEGVVMSGDPSPVAIELCCVDGNEIYGNPLTVKVPDSFEAWVEVGGTHSGGISRNVLISASFQTAPTRPGFIVMQN
jgi:hypothetical protein